MEQALQEIMEPDEEAISPDDFSAIDQFIRGLGEVKSESIMADDEGWV